jgi:hypothetical protein
MRGSHRQRADNHELVGRVAEQVILHAAAPDQPRARTRGSGPRPAAPPDLGGGVEVDSVAASGGGQRHEGAEGGGRGGSHGRHELSAFYLKRMHTTCYAYRYGGHRSVPVMAV